MRHLAESQYIPAASQTAGAGETGYRLVAAPPHSPLRYLEFALVTLAPEARPLVWESRDREAVVYLIGGVCEYAVSDGDDTAAGRLDSRPAVFDGPPSAVFLPPGVRIRMASPRSGARLALFSAPPAADRPIRQIGPDEVRVRTVGRDAWARRVCSVVDEGVASRLLVGETINQAGGWSSYPPHKHDSEVAGREVPMEEIYHYCVRPPGGFGLQMVYTAPDVPYPFAHTYRVGGGDTVVIPRGYHPVVAAGGYQIAYLWAISGERVEGGAWSDDPVHAWLGG